MEIKKDDKEGIKRWIINFIKNMKEFYYTNLSYYEDYEYIDELINQIFTKFDDFVDATINGVSFYSYSEDSNDNIINTYCTIKRFNQIENVFGMEGYLLFVKYENKNALYKSYVKLFNDQDKALIGKKLAIKLEIAGIDNAMEKLLEAKKEIESVKL